MALFLKAHFQSTNTKEENLPELYLELLYMIKQMLYDITLSTFASPCMILDTLY